MNYLTETQLNETAGLAVGLPQTGMARSASLVIGVFTVPPGATADLAWLSLAVLSLSSGPSAVPQKISAAYPAFWVGVQHATGLEGPAGTPIFQAGTALLGTAQTDPCGFWRLTTAGNYEVLVVNNTTNLDADVTAAAAVRLKL